MALSNEPSATSIQRAPPSTMALQSFEQFLSASSDAMEAMGEMVIKAGQLEKATGVALQDMAKAFMSVDMDSVLKSMGPERAMLFVSISLRLGAAGRVDLDKLNPDEKISFGTQWKALASDIRKLFEGVKEAIDPKPTG